MYEYKVVTLSVKESENTLNSHAKEGWKLIAMVPNIAKGMGMIATLERKAD